MQVMQYLRQTPALDQTTRDNLDKVRLTNLARLVNDPDVRKTLGLRVSNGEIGTDLPQDEILKGLTKIVDDLASERINVNDIKLKADRQMYLAAFGPQDIPDAQATTGKTWNLASGDAPAKQPETVTKPRRSVPPSTTRKTLVPTNMRLRIQH
jgi:hypothetical protein